MEKFTVKTKMSKIMKAPELEGYHKFLIYGGEASKAKNPAMAAMALAPLSALSRAGWSPEGIAAGLNFLSEKMAAGKTSIHYLYPGAQADAPQKEDVNLLRILPDGEYCGKETILLAAGGAYNSVCTLVEAIPTARHFSQLGHQVFLLTYRVRQEKAALMALDDLAKAVEYLVQNKDTLGMDPSQIVIGGFSAGANLISNWGMYQEGYGAYGLPKPKALLPIYTYIDIKTESKKDKKGGLIGFMFGPDYPEYLDRFNVVDHIDDRYPPCYLVCGKNDTTVPPVNSEMMKEKLDAAGVPAVLDMGENAPHGFGDGTGTDVEGWPERAAEFFTKL